MNRDLSSSATLLFKIVLPGAFLAGLGAFVVIAYLHPEQIVFNRVRGGGGPHLWYWLLAAWVLATIFFSVFLTPLKYVGIEGDHLLVSNYWTDWRVPFSSISDVRQLNWVSPALIIIAFKEDAGFGRSLLFLPQAGTPLENAGNNRELEELRQLAGLPIIKR